MRQEGLLSTAPAQRRLILSSHGLLLGTLSGRCRAESGNPQISGWPSDAHRAGTQPSGASGSRWGPRTSGLPPTPQCPNLPPSLPPLLQRSRPGLPPSLLGAGGRLLGEAFRGLVRHSPALRCPLPSRCCLLVRSSPHPRPHGEGRPLLGQLGTAPGKGRMPRYPSLSQPRGLRQPVVCFRCPG